MSVLVHQEHSCDELLLLSFYASKFFLPCYSGDDDDDDDNDDDDYDDDDDARIHAR